MKRVFATTLSTLTSCQATKGFHFFIICSACIAVLSAGGCSLGQPRRRLGSYATSTPGTRFVSAEKLGNHSYGFNPFETNGITYACKAGHIDIAHLRIAADNTRYMSHKLYKGILEDQTDFSFYLIADRSKHVVKLSYPENFQQMDKETVAREVSLQLGQYLAFSATNWHEVLTWFGYHTMIFLPEQPSAFSWEDVYSNLLGTAIAAKAIRDNDHKYDKAMTLALSEEMENLGGRSARTARKAAHIVRGKWFTGNFAVSMKKRNLDIGLDDGHVTPMIVPEICDDAKPLSLPAPSCDVSRHGFSMDYHIVPKELEKGKILSIVHKDRRAKTITPSIHYAPIIAHIGNVAIAKYGPDVAKPYNPDKIIAKELAKLAPSSAVKPDSSQNTQPRNTPEKDSPILASAPKINKKTIRVSVRKIARSNEPQITLNQNTDRQTPPKSTAMQNTKEYPALRTIVSPKIGNYGTLQKIINSTAKKLNLLEINAKPKLKNTGN